MDSASTSSSALSAGAIAGIVIGCAAFVAAVVGSVLYRQKMFARQREESLFADLSDTGAGFEVDYTAM
ncbi:repeat-containing protein [Phytophthora cinnamomi]|nr:repeat-containing protein [Phytophthora cinnamomi]